MISIFKKRGKVVKKLFKVNLLLEKFKKVGFLKNEQVVLFENYNRVRIFSEESVEEFFAVIAKVHLANQETLVQLETELDCQRNLIHKKENSSFIFAIELLTENGIMKYAKRPEIGGAELRKIRIVHLALLEKLMQQT